jgi:hypothetical protein
MIIRVVKKLVKETREEKNICGGSIASKTASGGNLKLVPQNGTSRIRFSFPSAELI